MQNIILCIFVFAGLTIQNVAAVARDDEPTKEQAKFFEEKIRPILSDHCYECHSTEKQESDLRLDSRESVLTGGASGPAVNLEEASDSLILKVLRYGGDVEMPPDQKLDDEIIEDIEKWIDWRDASGVVMPARKPSGPKRLCGWNVK